jgi:hypothetical protein
MKSGFAFIMCSAVVILVVTVLIGFVGESEVPSSSYGEINGWIDRYPAIRPMAAEAMRDGRVTTFEYTQMRDVKDSADHNVEKNKLAVTLTR